MEEKMIKVGIIGAAGYTAGELIRLLVHHPSAEIKLAQSESQAGKYIYEIHRDLVGDIDLKFVSEVNFDDLDVIFLCKGHGESSKFIESNKLPLRLKVIDLSHDFRLRKMGNSFVYGLPELNKELIIKASNIANPGCFASCIQFGLLPAAQSGIINSDIHISGITGSTGAGQSLSPTSHFSWRNNNMSVYKPFEHQHLQEIGESLSQVSDMDTVINFVPYRGNFTRGIITTSYFDTNVSLDKAESIYTSFYESHPFVHITKSNPDLKQVVNTNKAIVYLEMHNDKLMVISMIDNLLKGASGQAVQNMNLIFGLDEQTGLKMKSIAF